MDYVKFTHFMRYARTFGEYLLLFIYKIFQQSNNYEQSHLLRRANIKLEDMFAYAANKEKFATDKSMKRANFKAAYDQIEAALHGDDSGPLDVSRHLFSCYLCIDTYTIIIGFP